jgi:subtilisin family serine protease
VSGLAGTSVQVRLSFTTAGSPAAAGGAWIDDLSLSCYYPPASGGGYDYLQGTSMAAPHVTGTAGLLFSLRPNASVTQVRSALLDGVDAVPALSGKTVTGGRIDAAAALAALAGTVPPPGATTGPAGGSASAPGESPGAPLAPSTAPKGASCRVPKLKGKSLSRASAALKKAGCRLGKVSRPKLSRRRRGRVRLVVKAASPRAGSVKPAQARVNLALAVKKPAPHKRTRRS